MEPMKTMRPFFCSFMWGHAPFIARKPPMACVVTTEVNSSTVMFFSDRSSSWPAFEISTSMPPKAATQASTACSPAVATSE